MELPIHLQNKIALYNIHPVAEMFRIYINKYNYRNYVRFCTKMLNDPCYNGCSCCHKIIKEKTPSIYVDEDGLMCKNCYNNHLE